MLGDDDVAASVDVLVEGCTSGVTGPEARDVGRKAVAVNVADIEAVGARATGLLVGFSAPADLPLGWVLDFAEGIRHESHAAAELARRRCNQSSRHHHCGHRLGVTGGRDPVLRSGARPGNLVAIHGRLGWAAAGLVVLGRGSAHRGSWSRRNGCRRSITALVLLPLEREPPP